MPFPQRPQPSCHDLASRTQFIAGQPLVLHTTPRGLVKGDELGPKIQAAGVAGGCYIGGQVQEGKCGRLGRDAETFLRLPRRISLARQTNPILLWVDLFVALLI